MKNKLNIFKTVIYNKKMFSKYCLFLFFSVLLSNITLIIFRELINSVSNTIIYSQVIKLLLLYMIASLAENTIETSNDYLKMKYKMILDLMLEKKLLSRCKSLKIKDFENEKIYNQLSLAESQGMTSISQLFESCSNILNILLNSFLMIFTVIKAEWWMIIISLIGPIAKLILSKKINKDEYRIRIKRVEESRKIGYFRFLLSNNIFQKELSHYGLGDALYNYIIKKRESFLKVDLKIAWLRCLVILLADFFSLLVGGVIIFTLIKQLLLGEKLVGDFVITLSGLSIMMNNSSTLFIETANISKYKQYALLYYDFIDIYRNGNNKKSFADINNTKSLGDKINAIRLENVSFSYPTTKIKVLNSISAHFMVGKLNIISGINGCGKSTLLKVISLFYDDEYDGTIFVNNKNIKHLSLENLRKKISIQLQDFNKYELTYLENLLMNGMRAEDINFNELEYLENILNLSEVINSWDKNRNTQLGHWFGGTELSIGQWQKIAIIRAIISNKDVIILDEPTAFLDQESKIKLLEYLEKISVEKVIIIVSHSSEYTRLKDVNYTYL